ncbi:DUF748 domain-containing protein [Maribacter sp. ACAM166]|uniref:DUF748 domain-containing protein n=1 Tax=Maribacter sp. ACAM166 TaxID=2508996 RepID=UPI0014851D0B|nr:DUF748 domain-containing protein [Maribacter sp. ACAM166]
MPNLVPIDINQLTLEKRKFAFLQLQTTPNIDLNLSNINLVASNLRHIVEKIRSLPSNIHATATSIRNGKMVLDGDINVVKEIPDIDVSFSLDNSSAKALNDFINYFTGIDFNEGTFDLFEELAISDGFLKTLRVGFVSFFKFVLKNHKEDTLATKTLIEGDLNGRKIKI